MRQLQLIAHGEPSDVIKLNTVAEPALGQEDVLISIEAAPIDPSDFLLVRGTYGVRPDFPFSVGAEGVGRVAKVGSKVDVALQVVYAMQSGQFPAISPKDFIYRGLSLHGFWLMNWIRNAPRTEIQEIYQKLGDLVADGSLSAAVEHVYPLEQFKEAFEQSLKSNRGGKILFKFGATDGTDLRNSTTKGIR